MKAFLYPQALSPLTAKQLRALRDDQFAIEFLGMDDSHVLCFRFGPDDPTGFALTKPGDMRDVYGRVHRLPWWLLDTLPEAQRDLLCDLVTYDPTEFAIPASSIQSKPPIKSNLKGSPWRA